MFDGDAESNWIADPADPIDTMRDAVNNKPTSRARAERETNVFAIFNVLMVRRALGLLTLPII
jgi:hypothetical protein